jgi:hypothetical protein
MLIKRSFVFLVINLIVFSFSACSISNNEQKYNKNELLEQKQSSNSSEDNKKQSVDQTQPKTSLFSPKNYKVISELEGKVLGIEQRIINDKELLRLINKPIAYDGYGGFISSKENILLKITIDELQNIETEKDDIIIDCIDLPEFLSSNLELSKLFGHSKGNEIARNVIIDSKNNLLIVIDNASKKVIRAVQFDKSFELSKIKIIDGYYGNEGEEMLVTDEYNTLFILEADTLKIIKEIDMSNWKTISSYEDYTASGEEFLYLYQVNGNKVRKISTLDYKEVLSMDFNETPIRGEIQKISHEPVNLIYILSKFNDKNYIYITNEITMNFINVKENYDDGLPLGTIDGIWNYNEGQETILVLFDKKCSDIPIKFINTFANDWKELK